MKDKAKVIRECFREAAVAFLDKEATLLELDANERTLCAKLAYYIAVLLSEYGLDCYHVDVEYNRTKNFDIKAIYGLDFKMRRVICDLILHSRGMIVEHDNLLALEMKKWTGGKRSEKSCNSDRERLMALTSSAYLNDCVGDYSLGIFMLINRKQKICIFEEYQHGSKIKEWSVSYVTRNILTILCSSVKAKR